MEIRTYRREGPLTVSHASNVILIAIVNVGIGEWIERRVASMLSTGRAHRREIVGW